MLQRDVEAYIKGYNIYLALKAVCYKPYKDLQLLPITTHRWKNFSMNFVTGLLILASWKSDSYNLLLVIVDQLSKIVHKKLVKVKIDVLSQVEMIINVVVHHHGVLKSIVMDQSSLFISKFWSLLSYFLGIKKKLSTIFHPQIDGQIKRQNSIIEGYFRVFVN